MTAVEARAWLVVAVMFTAAIVLVIVFRWLVARYDAATGRVLAAGGRVRRLSLRIGDGPRPYAGMPVTATAVVPRAGVCRHRRRRGAR